MQHTINVDGKSVTIYRLSHDCDTYGYEANVNYSILDEKKDETKYLFVNCDTNLEADIWFIYLVNHIDELYINCEFDNNFNSLHLNNHSKAHQWVKAIYAADKPFRDKNVKDVLDSFAK